MITFTPPQKNFNMCRGMVGNMKTVFFDLETQYTFQELGMNKQNRDPTKLKLAVAGILYNKEHMYFEEGQIQELFETLNQADLIVGHNLLRFDYLVLQPYSEQNIIKKLQNNTLDTWDELRKVTGGCWTSLDDLAKRNLCLTKTHDASEIPKMWRDGKHQEVKDYLLNDLKLTEGVFNHGKNVGKFRYEHKDYGKSLGEREVSVKWGT